MNYLRFRVGNEWYGVEVDRVIEVLNFVALHEVPGTPPDVLGLLTLREMVMPVIDLRIRFGLEQAAIKLDTPIIAASTPHGAVGLVVDDVDDVVDVPEITDHHAGEMPYTIGAARIHDRLLLILDISQFREYVEDREMLL